MKTSNRISIAGLSLIFLWFLVIGASPVRAVETGDPVPDFVVRTLDGDTVSRAALSGRPMMIVFWNTWCPICRRELPKVNKLAWQVRPADLAILAVNTGMNDSEDKARAYWKKYGYVFPVGFDHGFKIVEAFRLIGVPTIILVDSKGIVRYQSAELPDDINVRIKKLKQ